MWCEGRHESAFYFILSPNRHIWFASPLGFMTKLWENGDLNLCSLYENFIKFTNKEDESLNLTLLCSLAYFVWIDRNNIVFNKSKPEMPYLLSNKPMPQSSWTLLY